MVGADSIVLSEVKSVMKEQYNMQIARVLYSTDNEGKFRTFATRCQGDTVN